MNMFWQYYQAPRPGEVYNAGGGRHSNCSMQEAIALCESCTGKKMDVVYTEHNRIGDHIWYISDTRKFQSHYPGWRQTYDLPPDHRRDLRIDVPLRVQPSSQHDACGLESRSTTHDDQRTASRWTSRIS